MTVHCLVQYIYNDDTNERKIKSCTITAVFCFCFLFCFVLFCFFLIVLFCFVLFCFFLFLFFWFFVLCFSLGVFIRSFEFSNKILRTGSSVIQCPSLISLYCLIYEIINEINLIVNGYSLIVRLLMQ